MNSSEKWGVVGFGTSGQAALRLLRALGKNSVVTFDDKAERADFSQAKAFIEEAKPTHLVVSPGVPLTTPWIAEQIAHGTHVTSELELALATLQGEQVVGVTGSLGKSTTVSLLGAGVKTFAPDSFVGGNLGTPLATYAADVLEGQRSRATWVILELSSYQLEKSKGLVCEAAAITYLSPNHMERYKSLDEYYSVKWQLAERAKKIVVLNEKGGDLRRFAEGKKHSAPLAWVSDVHSLIKTEIPSRLLGSHNRDNLAVAAEIGNVLAWPKVFIEGMLAFSGLPHRLENLGSFGGVRFVNDSKATAMDSVLTATKAVLESRGNGKVWLLLGGRDKKLPWNELSVLREKSNLAFVFFGECRELAQKQSGLAGPNFEKLSTLMPSLRSMVSEGDTVLLSPGGTSLDEFKNFEDRGLAFASMAKDNFS